MSCGKTDRGARVSVVSRLACPQPKVRGAHTTSKARAIEEDSVVLTKGEKAMQASDILNFVMDWRRLRSLVQISTLPADVRDLLVDLGGAECVCVVHEQAEFG